VARSFVMSSWTGAMWVVSVGDPIAVAAEPPNVQALFRFGSNSIKGKSEEYSLQSGAHAPSAPRGHLTWDSAYGLRGRNFHSVAVVRLEMDRETCRFSVGTTDFIKAAPALYSTISKVQIVAGVTSARLNRMVRWDSAEVTFIHEDGFFDTYASPCLPRADNSPRRRATVTQSHRDRQESLVQQYAEINASTDNVVAVRLLGQVTLCATDPSEDQPLEPDDLQGHVYVYTNPPQL
jgi:hypothetical protein